MQAVNMTVQRKFSFENYLYAAAHDMWTRVSKSAHEFAPDALVTTVKYMKPKLVFHKWHGFT